MGLFEYYFLGIVVFTIGFLFFGVWEIYKEFFRRK